MKRLALLMKTIATGIFILLIVSCNNDASKDTAGGDTAGTDHGGHDTTNNSALAQSAEATLSGTFADTTVNGTVQFTQQDGQVKMVLNITVPAKANKSVAVHIHEHGNCGDTAKHAGGHWNPTNTNHGEWGKEGFHVGDIGNVTLDAQGKGQKELTTDLWSLGGDAQKNILDKTILVHGGTDDYKSQPAGNSGTRIGCGVIQRKG